MTHELSVEGCTRAKQDGDTFSRNGEKNRQNIRDMNEHVQKAGYAIDRLACFCMFLRLDYQSQLNGTLS